jgi:hypothetical protein
MLLARSQPAIPSDNQVAGIPAAQEPSEFVAGSAESADADAPSDIVLAAPDTASLSSELNSPMESQQAQLNHPVDQQVSDVVPDLPLTRRSARVSRRRTVVSSDEEDEEEGCSISGCMITGSEPMVTCLGPACSTQVKNFNLSIA